MSICELLLKSSNLLGEFNCLLKCSSSNWVLCFSKLGFEGSDSLFDWLWFGCSGFLLGLLQSFLDCTKLGLDGFSL
jgi:hypothetical protein